MNRKPETDIRETSELTVPVFGYELVRDELLNDLLGKNEPEILYWAGKRLARKYPLFSVEEVEEFFSNAGWGELQLSAQKNNEMHFTLSSPLIDYRLQTRTDINFQLEAGFLAEQIQQQKKVYAECYEHPGKENGYVRFTVKWDRLPLD